jgi:beta-lactamase regulating signal transducer with metallopeptidase domain
MMNGWLEELNGAAVPILLDHVWPMLWQSSLLIVLVALAGRSIFRKASPQLRYALWGLVLIRLVVPPWVDLPTALGNWGMPAVHQQVAAYVPLEAAAPAASAMLQRPLVGGVSPALSNGVTDMGGEMLSAVTPPVAWSLALGVIALWALGIASLLLLLLARLFRMHREVKRGAPAPAWIADAVAHYRTTLGVRLPVRVRVVPGNQSPALMGLLRPTILLPQGALDNLREYQLRAVLAHEIAHVKRWPTARCAANESSPATI